MLEQITTAEELDALTREQIIEQMAQAHFNGLSDDAQRFWDVDDAEGLLAVMGAGLPVAVKAVTDRVREVHYEEFDSDSDEVWRTNGKCACCRFSYPCPTVLLLDQIDTEMGGER